MQFFKKQYYPTKEDIERLKDRNKMLSKLLTEKRKRGKAIDEFNLAIEKDYVNKFWIGCKS